MTIDPPPPVTAATATGDLEPDDQSSGPAEDVTDAGDDAPVPSASGPPAGRRARSRRRLIRVVVAGPLLLVVLVLLVLVATNAVVTRGATGLTYDDVADVPVKPVAIVFGTLVVDGSTSPRLADRVHGAVELFTQGRVSHLLLTGDRSGPNYDEPSAMRDQAMNEGVPASAITRDDAGFSTYDSCYRARDIFGVRDAVLVTQDYHLSRALFTCRDLGINAVGLAVPDWQHHPERLTWTYPADVARGYMTREYLARTRAVITAKVTHPAPRELGPYLGLTEN